VQIHSAGRKEKLRKILKTNVVITSIVASYFQAFFTETGSLVSDSEKPPPEKRGKIPDFDAFQAKSAVGWSGWIFR
jgi:hypothetical protein